MARLVRMLLVLGVCTTPLLAQSTQDRTAARAIAAKYGDAIVSVLGVAKIHMKSDGQEGPVLDSKVQANAVVLNDTGLTVMPLAALDPTEAMSLVLGAAGGAAGSKVQISSEPSDLRLRLSTGREVEAHVVLRDPDLGVAFLRPVNALDRPVAALDGPSAAPGVMDAVVGLQRYGEMTGWQVGATLGYVQLIIDRPRVTYLVSTAGAAIFTMAGKFIGLLVIKHGAPTDLDLNPFAQTLLARATGAMDGVGGMSLVVPADDIRAAAKRATDR